MSSLKPFWIVIRGLFQDEKKLQATWVSWSAEKYITPWIDDGRERSAFAAHGYQCLGLTQPETTVFVPHL
jgi:hypothetical protein